jgi:hypothetical protein
MYLIVYCSNYVAAQSPGTFKTDIEVQAIGTSKKEVPFWLRSNQYGSIPLSGISTSLFLRHSKDYEISTTSNTLYRNKKFFWGYGTEVRANGGNGSNLQLIEGYLKAKASIFQLKVGRTKDVMGLTGDTALSSGNFAVSGNALGIPKIELSIPQYVTLPFFQGIFAFKGNVSHGWLGHIQITKSVSALDNKIYELYNTNPITYLHQKSFYGRLGKDAWKLKLYGGFSHQVFWGGEQSSFGPNFELSKFKTFLHVLTGQAYGNEGVPTSKIGNQLGSIDLAAEFELKNVKIKLYRQNIYDVGALAKLANIRDGLNGVTFENKAYKETKTNFKWKTILFEHFYSKDQAGYPSSIPTKSGDEDYYNNFYYISGWSYFNQGLGNPLITPRHYARDGQADYQNDYFINNRVSAFHLGLSGIYQQWDFLSKLTYSTNFGTFGTSKYGKSTGSIRFPSDTNLFETVNQFSFYLEAMRPLPKNYYTGFALSLDQGKLLNNSFGLVLKVKKSF